MSLKLPRLLSAWLLAWGLLQGTALQAMEAAPISSGSTYHLSAAAIGQLKQQAQSDDNYGKAAFLLHQYHAFSALNQGIALKWLATAAWQGHATAQYNWTQTLIDQGQPEKAKAWVAQARQHRQPLDAKALELLDGL